MDMQTLATVLPTAMSATLYTLVQSSFVWAMRRRRPPPLPAVRPWVSILKPIAGVDDELAENLESFAAIDYPAYEILFGFASSADPGVPVVQAFLGRHPEVAARIVWRAPAGGAVLNPQVAQLVDLTRRARGSVLVVSDANVRVPPTYLGSLVAALLAPGVGIVSSVIAGRGERSLGAALENAQLGASVAPAVVAAHRVFGRPITVGKSMAMRRSDLERAGGWEAVAGVLAEDDVLGQRFHALGFGVELCLEAVENRNVGCSAWRSVERHARWAKMRRGIVPHLFAFEILMSPLGMAALTLLLAPSALTEELALLALGLQCVGALLAHTTLGARRPLLLAAMEPVRVLAAFVCWCLAATSRRVAWRGNVFEVGAGSRLVPVAAEVEDEIAVE